MSHRPEMVAAGSDRASTADLSLCRLDLANVPWPSDVMALMEAAAKSTIQATFDWFQNLSQTVYAQHPGAQIYALRQGSALLAVLPVLVVRSRMGNTLTFLSNYYTALFVPAIAPGLSVEVLAQALRQLARLFRPLAEFRLEPMDPSASHFHQLQQALKLAGFVANRFYRFGNWYLPTEGSYADFLKMRTSGLRSTIKRMGKRCAEQGGAIEILTHEADVARGLQAYWKVYKSSWKVDEPFPAFIDGLVHWTARAGKLRLGILSLNGEPVAAQIWFVHKGRAEIFKVAYVEAQKAVSPGSVLTAALMERVIDQDKVNEVDFLMGDDAYKRTWMSHRRERWGLVAYSTVLPKGMYGLARLYGGRLIRRLRPNSSVTAVEAK